MSRPEDESRTELAWREIVENYGERPVLDDAPTSSGESATAAEDAPPAAPSASSSTDLPEHLRDDDEVERREQAIAESERFKPPPAPPFPVPRTWERGLAWAGIFVAPVIALVIGLLSIYVHPLVGWALVGWFVGGFAYLVFVMPKAPRDPWDDGSRI
ncbi:hypothetical protein [Nocardioides sp. zg-1230]|uniref:hypothetical protein n=1 Tax=Nocardioides sp. zg-1230 TaxID=2736601 RepID=UPI00155252D8|nr:hypothetical protein [Nocardioides sp. zg-1230]NPC43554.1 hypothetical protein [Nocardioides sp. zg-1230]